MLFISFIVIVSREGNSIISKYILLDIDNTYINILINYNVIYKFKTRVYFLNTYTLS